MIRLPGLIDPHVHVREPGATHKEDWDTVTQAALAGGFTTILAMPNTNPPVTDNDTLSLALSAAHNKAHCDYGQFIGAGQDNVLSAASLSQASAGLKMYLDQTYGPLRLDEMTLWTEHISSWPANRPIVAHAESRSIGAVILIASILNHAIHIAHVARREEILLIRAAKEKGIQVTCEVCPHHLFLSQIDIEKYGGKLSGGRSEVRPHLANPDDQMALWENLDYIDCFATDHAPHTLKEKDGPNPPPGFPGLETALPLYLNAVHSGRLTLDDIVLRCYTNPKKIFSIPDQIDTYIEIDTDTEWRLSSRDTFTRCGWMPFEGFSVRGRLERVVLHGKTAFENGQIFAAPGTGVDIREKS